MRSQARMQAAIELLDEVIGSARTGGAAADTLIARYFGARRYAGAKDRRAVRELVYAAIRALGEVPASGRAAMLALAAADPAIAAAFDGSAHAPVPIAADEPVATRGVAPAWLIAQLEASGLDAGERQALLDRAPLDLRINALKADPDAQDIVPGATPVEGVGGALRLGEGVAVDRLAAWQGGAIEVQDAGSQLVAAVAGAKAGNAVVDLCAGAGGKTLALAAAMANRGTILACDVDRARLRRLSPRAERAGATIVETRLLDPGREGEALSDWQGRADIVFVDAPCSGTGTWRRNPEARWRLTPDRLAKLVDLQRHVLDLGATLVRPGGALLFVTCSVLDAEGYQQVDGFLADHADWQAEPPAAWPGTARGAGLRLTPAQDATDGFFVARLRRPC